MDATVNHTRTERHQAPDNPMASIDHAWLRMDSEVSPMVINAVLTFKTAVKASDWLTRVSEKFTPIERFRCRPEPGLYGEHWHPCQLDNDYHFQIDSEPLESDLDLQRKATAFINTPLDKQRPLWRMKLISNYKKGSAIIVRIHHSYADGMALVRVLLQLMDEGGPLNPKNFKSKKKQITKGLFDKVQSMIPKPGRWLETLSLVEELSTELVKMGLSPQEENVFKEPGQCGKKSLVWTPPLKLDEVRAIAKTHQAKLNDVLLSSVSGAFRRYMKQVDHVSSWTELRTVVPVDIRKHVKSESLGNYFGLVFLNLPIGIEDPIERAFELNKRMNALKTSKQAWLVFQILQMSGYLPEVAEKELVRLFSSKASAVLTNVPGPQQALHFCGHELDQILFWVPQSGSIGTGVSVMTYNNQVQFGLMTDDQLVNAPQMIIDCFNTEFESLLLETLMTLPWPVRC